MSKKSQFDLTQTQIDTLTQIMNDEGNHPKKRTRAKILLELAEGQKALAVAFHNGVQMNTVYSLKKKFEEEGYAALESKHRGRTSNFSDEHKAYVATLLSQTPPVTENDKGETTENKSWNIPLLTEAINEQFPQQEDGKEIKESAVRTYLSQQQQEQKDVRIQQLKKNAERRYKDIELTAWTEVSSNVWKAENKNNSDEYVCVACITATTPFETFGTLYDK